MEYDVQPTRPRDRVVVDGGHALVDDIRRLREQVSDLAVQVGRLMPRAEIERNLSALVNIDVFNERVKNIEDRTLNLESKGQRNAPWISILISSGFGCLSLFLTLILFIAGILLKIH